MCYNAKMRFSDQLRKSIAASGLTAYRIAKDAGINPSVLSRFLSGKGVGSDSIDRLATVLKWRLASGKAKKSKRE